MLKWCGGRLAVVWVWTVALAFLVGGEALAAAERPYPVVLAPGFLGFREMGAFGAHWRGWRGSLEADGYQVFEHMPTPVATSEQRADELLRTVREVKRRTGAARVIVIAHSQGGLDARLALERGGATEIAAVATLSAPHHGTPLADAALAWFPPTVVQPTLAVLQRIWQVENDQPFSSPQAERAIASLTTASRGQTVLARSSVPVFSFGAVAGADVDGSCNDAPIPAPTHAGALLPLTYFPRALISSRGPASNDGVVTTSSMRHGRFVGCIAGDHGVWLGWNPMARFDHVRFARTLARALTDVAAHAEPSRFDAYLPEFRALAAPANHR